MQIYIQSSLLVCALLCALSAFVLTMRMAATRKRARPYRGFDDLLDYALLDDDDTIVLKNGGLMRVYRLELKCLSDVDEESLESIHTTLLKAFNSLDETVIVNYDMLRSLNDSRTDLSYFGPQSGKNFFCERLRNLDDDKTFHNEFFVSLTRLNTAITPAAFYEYLKSGGTVKGSEFEKASEEFKRMCAAFMDALGAVGQSRLCTRGENEHGYISHEAVNFIKKCLSGSSPNLKLSDHRMFLDCLLSSDDFTAGLEPRMGRSFIGVVAVDGLPSLTHMNILNALGSLNFTFRFSIRYISLSKLQTDIRLSLYQRMWQQKRRGLVAQFLNVGESSLNLDAVEMVENISDAKKDLSQNTLRFGALSCNLIIFDEDRKELMKKCDECLKLISKCGFSGRIENINATEAYLGSLPGHHLENIRRLCVSSSILCDLLPLSSEYRGELFSPNPYYGPKAPALMMVRTANDDIGYLNLHDKDLGNTLVVGPPGSGKSVFLGALAVSLLRYEGMKIFAFDRGRSLSSLCDSLGGNQICLDESSTVRFCPLLNISTPEDKSRALCFVRSLYTYAGRTLSSAQESELKKAVDLIEGMSEEHRSLSDFYDLITDRELKSVIGYYTQSDAAGSLLDGSINPDMHRALSVFECGRFFENDPRTLYPTLDCIFSLIAGEVLKAKSSAIIIDEAWLMMSNQNFARELISWIKTFRKHNVAVIMATQSISDFSRQNLLEDILDCVKTRVFLPNKDVTSPVLRPLYEKFGLNGRQLQKIAEGQSKHDLFLHKGAHFMPFSLCVGKDELAVLSSVEKGRSNEQKQKTADELEES